MISGLFKFLVISVLLLGAVECAFSQPPEVPDATTATPRGRREDIGSRSLKEMLIKQQIIREKKDYEEMLERGEEALRITKQLQASFEQNKSLSSEDRARLASLENTVEKIRKELGGGDDTEIAPAEESNTEEVPKPSSVEDAFKYLQQTTVKLVDELKKTTRFSISVIAIQTSNNVLKLVRFLRFKK